VSITSCRTSTEHAFQAAKTLDMAKRQSISTLLKPAEAKRAGHRLDLRDNWNNIRVKIMWDVVLAKFQQNYLLREKLLQTGECLLVEANRWHDNFYGVCYCDSCGGYGQNYLGRTLMYVREQLANVVSNNELPADWEWCPDIDNEFSKNYKNCCMLVDPEAGRKAMVWELDNGHWRWDSEHERDTCATKQEAQQAAEREVLKWRNAGT
jgi:N-glycosidase YbiA